MSSDAFAEGIPHLDEGPVLGSGWWYFVSLIVLLGGLFLGWQMYVGSGTADDERRQIAIAIAVLFALPVALTIVRLILLRRRIGTAQLFVPHQFLPLGFNGTATYMRPLRGGAVLRQIEAHLQCVEWLEKGSGKNRKTYKAIVYDEPITPVTTPMMERMRVQIPFRIPEQGPASLMDSRAGIRWLLKLRLKMDGCPNTRSSFEIHVFPVVVKR